MGVLWPDNDIRRMSKAATVQHNARERAALKKAKRKRTESRSSRKKNKG